MIRRLLGCMFSCKPVVKIFLAYRAPFRRSPDDLPWRICIGSKSGGSMTLTQRSTFFAALKARALVLDWLDSEDGQACYLESLKMLVGGYVLGEEK